MKQKKKAEKKEAGRINNFLDGMAIGREQMARDIAFVLGSARNLGEHNLHRYADALLSELEDSMYELEYAEAEGDRLTLVSTRSIWFMNVWHRDW